MNSKASLTNAWRLFGTPEVAPATTYQTVERSHILDIFLNRGVHRQVGEPRRPHQPVKNEVVPMRPPGKALVHPSVRQYRNEERHRRSTCMVITNDADDDQRLCQARKHQPQQKNDQADLHGLARSAPAKDPPQASSSPFAAIHAAAKPAMMLTRPPAAAKPRRMDGTPFMSISPLGWSPPLRDHQVGSSSASNLYKHGVRFLHNYVRP